MDLGRLVGKARKAEIQLARRYEDGQGKKRWQGTKALKSSQSLSPPRITNVQMFEKWFAFFLQLTVHLRMLWKPSSVRTYPAGFARSIHDLLGQCKRGKRNYFEKGC